MEWRVRRWARAAIGLCVVLAACSSSTEPAPTVGNADPTSTNTERVELWEFTEDVVVFSDTSADVLVPVGSGPFPAVVTVHGGGFTTGSNEFTRPIAELLASNGFVVFNTGYELSTPARPALPVAVSDVACAVRLAARHPQSDGTVAVVGVSAGAQMATLVAFTGDAYREDCPDTDAVAPSRLIALGFIDITGVNSVVLPGDHPMFQKPWADVTDTEWYNGDPLNHAAANPTLQALFIHAENDEFTTLAAAESMVSAMTDVGATGEVTISPGIGHFSLGDTDATGQAITDWLAEHPPP